MSAGKKASTKAYDRLGVRQKAFVDAYLQSFCSAKAARDAGYSIGTARQIGYENLTKPDIRDAIEELLLVRGITRSRILQQQAAFAFGGDVADYEGIAKGKTLGALRKSGVDTRCIRKVKTKVELEGVGDEKTPYLVTEVELIDKVRALDSLGRMIGMAGTTELSTSAAREGSEAWDAI